MKLSPESGHENGAASGSRNQNCTAAWPVIRCGCCSTVLCLQRYFCIAKRAVGPSFEHRFFGIVCRRLWCDCVFRSRSIVGKRRSSLCAFCPDAVAAEVSGPLRPTAGPAGSVSQVQDHGWAPLLLERKPGSLRELRRFGAGAGTRASSCSAVRNSESCSV